MAIHNGNEESVYLDIRLRGGLPSNDIEVENGFTKITEKATETYKDSILNGADPVLGEKMVPITIDDNGTVHYASLYSEWYNYSSKKWANAIILVNNPSQDYKIGDIILEQDIQSYFVWIPRYKYKIWNLGNYTSNYSLKDLTDTNQDAETSLRHITGTARLIDIVFQNKNEKTKDDAKEECAPDNTSGGGKNCQVDYYMTHPAFTLGTDELNGIWVGKFETGYNQNQNTNAPIPTTIEWNMLGAQQDKTSSENIIVKPNTYAWRNITIGNIFHTALGYKQNLESHMMKNTEWGAVAYLAQSGYGIGNEIRINNNSVFLTGYSSAPNLDQSSYRGESGNTLEWTKPYNTPIGYLASTTGNITGIYDMAGGAYEYMASYMEGHAEKTSLDVISGITSSDLTMYAKYFDKYANNSNVTSYNNRILGDATGEMGPFYVYYDKDGSKRNHNSWYADFSYFVSSGNPWASRSGDCNYGVWAGQFNFNRVPGNGRLAIGFRLILTGKEEITS